MNQQIYFNKLFGKRWYQRLDKRFIMILSIVFTGVFGLILHVANLNYNELLLEASRLIHEKYKERIAQVIISDREERFSEIDGVYLEEQPGLQPEKRTIEDSDIRKTTGKTIKSGDAYDRYAGLPGLEEESYYADVENIPRWVELNQPARNTAKSQTDNNAASYDHDLERIGSFYIPISDEMFAELPRPNGYRNPDEINRVIDDYFPMIQYCFQKEARHFTKMNGFVKVQFDISYEGYVVPESIRLLNSTIRNKEIEQCIKKFIQRWKNFERLDESMGITQVVQKFVFDKY
ncbi:MAG: AgmX/PglI C-terminal domain-containing protein [Calditrichaceae bacterium]|nr:AgmX/PglI C-terminal domain-containing protein [Calditrichaceae bacterium]MBN2710530.1 AgmX/PglI C-terminal domain-containing protein [Calditrichaceae bacterium]RQV96556.1 MAG: hypothetical protein EH224_04260 [Calditrichota bacterium]